MTISIIKKADLFPAPADMSNDDVASKVNAAIAHAKLNRMQYADVDLSLGGNFPAARDDVFTGRVIGMLKAAGYDDAFRDGRSGHFRFRLR